MPTMLRSPRRIARSVKSSRESDAAIAAVLDVFCSDLGWIVISAVGRKLLGITFGHKSKADALAAAKKFGMTGHPMQRTGVESGDAAWLADVRERFIAFAGGAFEDFRDLEIEIDHLSPFERAVVQACRAIPYGATMSYGELAAKVGHRGAARAVGRVMATNRYPLVVPCHRVLASGGGLGGYSAPQGLAMKRRLLAMEADGICLPR